MDQCTVSILIKYQPPSFYSLVLLADSSVIISRQSVSERGRCPLVIRSQMELFSLTDTKL